MNKNYLMLLALVALGLSACRSDERTPSGGGYLAVRVAADNEVVSAASRAEGDGIPDVGDFSLSIAKENGELVSKWDKFSDYDAEATVVPVGTYTVSASYGDATTEGFDGLSKAGSTTANVAEGETTDVTIDCTINKARVSISYTDAFKSYFTSYSAYVSSSRGNKIDYTADETRAAYFTPGNLDVYLNVTRPGVSGSVALKVKTLAAEVKHEYRLTMDVDAGTSTLNIIFNDDPESTQNVEFNISDAALNAPAPTIVAHGFTSGEAMEVVEGGSVEGTLQAYLNAPSGLAGCELVTSSAALKAQGWPEKVDLMALSAEDQQKLTELGLVMKGLGSTHDKIATVEFQNVVPYLYCTGDGNEEHSFTLTATDVYGKTTETPLVLNVTSRNNGFAVTLPESVPYGSNTMSFTMNLEGDASKVKFYYYNLGAFQLFTSENVSISSEGTTHTVTLTYPDPLIDTESDVKFKAQYGSKTIEKAFKVEDPELTLSLKNGDADVWAKHVNFQVSSNTDDGWVASADNVIIQYMDNKAWKNVSFTYSTTGYVVTGLSSGQSYTFRVIGKDDQTKTSAFVDITTESELSVPNAGMEDWYYTRPSGVEYWEVWYACKDGEQAVWNTMNQLTTSEGGTSGGINRDKYRYNANSGTIRAEGKNGGYAAQIRAVGWGKGNSAVGSANAKYGTVGELYLGYYDSEAKKAVYDGIEFTSRPKSLSFDYKYTPGKGGDQYYAEIVILNKQGDVATEIGRGLLRKGDSVQEWSSTSVDIVYTEEGKKLKATNMYIVFKSGDKSDNSSFNTVPSFGNLSNGEYVGSEFFVDNIVLNYE